MKDNFVVLPDSEYFLLESDPNFQLERNLLLELCKVHNTPRSLTVALLLQYGEWRTLLDLDINFNDYLDNSPLSLTFNRNTLETVKNDYLVTKFIQKSTSFLDKFVSVDYLKERAKASFFEAEEICFRSMLKLRNLPDDSELITQISKVRIEADSILGDLTPDDLQYIEEHTGPGSGGTTSVTGDFTADEKYCEYPHVTRRLFPFVQSICGPLWGQHVKPELVEGNRFTSVRKNAKTDRGICIEPDMNVFVQRAIGKLLKGRLSRTGNSIKYQEKNQTMAARAYKDGLATIDLSMASDTISYYLVFSILGPMWFDLLNLCRSPTTKINGKVQTLHKFSSMGNGYTFELETLLFLSVARSIIPKALWSDISVYGDDIIVPQTYAAEVVALLEDLGLLVNNQKSFLAGNFYESCGHDYFCGYDIRPIFARGSEPGDIPYAMKLANQIRIYSKIGTTGYCDAKYRTSWDFCKNEIPRRWLKLRVPEILGDAGLIDDSSGCRFNRHQKDGLEGWFVKTIKVMTKERNRNGRFSLLLYNLARCGSDEPVSNYGKIVVRNQFGDPCERLVFVQKTSCNLRWLR